MNHRPLTVLVVDDALDWRAEISEFFEDRGCQVVAVGDKETALEQLSTRSFDLAVIDVNLADEEHNVDGILLCHHIHRNKIGTRVILISARILEVESLVGVQPVIFIRKSEVRDKLKQVWVRLSDYPNTAAR